MYHSLEGFILPQPLGHDPQLQVGGVIELVGWQGWALELLVESVPPLPILLLTL